MIQMSIDSWIYKQIVICSGNRKIHSNERKQLVDLHNDKDKSQKHYSEQEKPTKKKVRGVWLHVYETWERPVCSMMMEYRAVVVWGGDQIRDGLCRE